MKTLKTNILAVITTLLLPVFAAAAPNLINYQGRLVDNNGNPMTGTKSVVFKIFDAASAGTQLWTETQSVTLENGIFSVKLGAAAALTSNVYSADDRYLEITVDAVTLAPRVQLVSVPFALAASNITSANNVSISTGVIVSGHVQAVKFYGDGSALTGRLTAPDITLTYGIGASTAVFSNSVTAPSYVMAANVSMGSGAPAAYGGGVIFSSNVYVVGFTSATSYYGDGSALTGIAATSIGNNAVGSSQIIDGSIATADIGASQVADSNIAGMAASKLTGMMSYPASSAYGGGMQVSTNVYIVGFSSAARYYGDGSALTGISASVIAADSVNSANIVNDSIVDADIKAAAGIAYSKLALGNSVVTGDIVDGTIADADLAGSISPSKITGTAAIVGANTFTGAQTYGSGSSIAAAAGQAGVNVSTAVYIGSGADISTITPTGIYGNYSGSGANLTNLNPANLSAAVGLAKGGSGADLSATGGANQFVRQNSAGGAFSVSAIADADVPDTITLANITQVTNRAITDLTGTLAVGNGGTGATDAATARSNLSAAGLGTNTFTGAQTYGSGSSIAAAASEAGVSVSTAVFVGSGANVSTVTPAGFYGSGANLVGLNPANIDAGTLGANVMASSVALAGFYSAPAVRSNLGLAIGTDVASLGANTFTGAQTYGSGSSIAAAAGQAGVSVSTAVYIGSGADISTITPTGFAGSGANLTSLTAANIAAGSLGSSVIASSIAVGAVYTQAIADSAVTSAKIGSLGAALTFGSGSSIAAAAGQDGVKVSTAVFVGGVTTANTTAPMVVVSTASTSNTSLCMAGAFATLPTSGYPKGCFAYQTSDNIAYISTEAVAASYSWKPLW